MAEISPQRLEGHQNRAGSLWETISQVDTVLPYRLEGGKYSVIATGTFGETVELMWSSEKNGTYISIDSTNLLFSADLMYNMEVPQGYIKPVLGGAVAVTDVDMRVYPLPNHDA